jgi:endonuclease G
MGALDEQVQAAQQEQMKAAAKRYEDKSEEREEVRRVQEATGQPVHDTLDQLNARAERLVKHGETPIEAMVKVAVSDIPDRKAALERIIGETNDLQSWSFLPRGARVAASVARISELDNGREIPLGTGFLVSQRLLMTNNHVLPSEASARQVMVEFGAEVDIDNAPGTPTRYRLDPATFFVTDEQLDFTLVLVETQAGKPAPGDSFGRSKLIRGQGKIVIGEPVNIIGHPMGRLKEIAIRNNRLELQLEQFLHYASDTEPGNSGSPVFNDQWEVVALHHSGVPRLDGQGRYLRKDGKLWQRGDGDDAIDWIANEGARVSVILDRLKSMPMTEAQRQILEELGPEAEVSPGQAGPAAATPAGEGGVITVPAPVTATVPAPDPTAVPAVVPPGDGSAAAIPSQRATESAAGLIGRPRGDVNIVYLHGRSQQGRDPGRLRRGWSAGLNQGLTLAGLPSIDPDEPWFPFYGDRFAEVLSAKERLESVYEALGSPDLAEALAPPEESSRQIYEELLAEAARDAGMPDLPPVTEEGIGRWGPGVVGKLQKQLSWLAGRSGLDDRLIALLFRDVAAYLDKPDIRDAVLDVVLETMPASGRMVLVSHSLGTVVAMDLLTRLDPAVEVPLLITAGSPLGMDAVYKRLLSAGPHRPERVGRWVNVFCPPDPVAIGCPVCNSWAGQVEEIVTANPKERAHAIEEYLADARVARSVSAAVTAPPMPVG